MTKNSIKSYKLYALPLTNENITLAADERFSRATPAPAPGYVLVYTGNEKPHGAHEIKENDAELLTVADKQWLFDCGVAILAEEIEMQKPEILADLNARIDSLRSELEKETQRLKERE